MSNFTFYKKRNFNAYINDTFSFFKIYAKNFFTNYLVINGAIMIAFGLILNFSIIYFTGFWNSGITSFGGVFFLSFILLAFILFFFLLIQCYPIAYLELAEKEPHRTNFTAKEIFSTIQKMLGKVFLFGIISIFIIYIPYIIIYVLISFIPILGFFGGIFLSILSTLFITQATLLFVKDKMGYFDALGKAKDLISVNFWEKWGATAIMNLIIYTFTIIVLILPVIVIVFGALSGVELENIGFLWGIVGFIMILFIVIIISIAANFQVFLQLMIYLSEKEDKRINEIDLIGQDNEVK